MVPHLEMLHHSGLKRLLLLWHKAEYFVQKRKDLMLPSFVQEITVNNLRIIVLSLVKHFTDTITGRSEKSIQSVDVDNPRFGTTHHTI